jgi:hypothetical protein
MDMPRSPPLRGAHGSPENGAVALHGAIYASAMDLGCYGSVRPAVLPIVTSPLTTLSLRRLGHAIARHVRLPFSEAKYGFSVPS